MTTTVHDPETCSGKDVHWRLTACNETGWHCADCGGMMPGEPNGFRPDLDRSHTGVKVDTILLHLTESDFLYVSNSTDGDSIVYVTAEECKKRGVFDQASIASMLCDKPSHATYWRDIAEGVLNGTDKRSRCFCGKLASRWVGGKSYCSNGCEKNDREQMGLKFEDDTPWQR